MTEEKQENKIEDKEVVAKTAELKVAQPKMDNKESKVATPIKGAALVKDDKKTGNTGAAGGQKNNQGNKRARRPFNRNRDDKKDEFDQRILDIARVTRVMAGGKRMSFRACVAIGDKKGKVAVGLGKGADVAIAVNKAVNKAKKDMVEVPMVNETVPHEVFCQLGAAKVLFKPARRGRGVIAGGVVRVILELAGVHNITSKILGTNNKVSNARCTIAAIKKLKKIDKKPAKTITATVGQAGQATTKATATAGQAGQIK